MKLAVRRHVFYRNRSLGSACALACAVRRLAERTTNVRAIVRHTAVSGEGAGKSTRGACAPQFICSAFMRLVINPINLPGSIALMTANQNAVFELQVPFSVCPRFFVPPISGKHVRAALIDDFAANFFALKMPIFRTKNQGTYRRSKSS